MENQQAEVRKRNVAYKLRIGDILKGRPVVEESKFLYLDLNGDSVVRVNILANCVDKFVQEGEKKYATITIDDASGQIKLKAFGDDSDSLSKVARGDTLQVIGVIREWNAEVYIVPEVVKSVDPRWLLVRKLEIQNAKKDLPVSENASIREKILMKIKEAEVDGGIDRDALVMDVQANPDAISTEIKKLIEDGQVYEPRPGRIRYLG